MRKNKKQRKVMLYLIIALGITIGFALISTTLNITGIAGVKKNTWDIHWDRTSVALNEQSVTKGVPVVSGTNDDTVTFTTELELPGDYYEFTIDAINEGTIAGVITKIQDKVYLEDGVTETTLPDYILYSVEYNDGGIPALGDVLAAGESEKYKVRVEFDPNATTAPSSPVTYKFSYQVTYSQTKDGIEDYKIGDMVYFDPVNYEYCKYDQSSTTCYVWSVINKNNTSIELFLLDDIPAFKWSNSNPATIIQSATSTWDERLLNVDSSYDIDVTDSFKVQFSDKKGRMLLKSEYDVLPAKTQSTMQKSCGLASTVCGILDMDDSFVKQIVPGSVSTTYPFSSMASGAKLGDGTTVRPVIKVSLVDKKHRISDDTYNVGDIVYFDPVTEQKCDSNTFNFFDVRDDSTTCYRWRVLTTNDTSKKTKVTIQLDHNLANGHEYTGKCGVDSATGPSVILPALTEETDDWVRIPLLNYEYDLGYVPDGPYGEPPEPQKLVCVNGACKVDRQTSADIPYSNTGTRVRMITGEELMSIIRTEKPDAIWNFNDSDHPTDVFYFSTSNSFGQIQNQNLKWLIENTRDNSESGATYNRYSGQNYYYYWMLTPDYASWLKGYWANYIYFYGYTDSTGACISQNLYSAYGARPVTEINKNMITKN